MASDAHAHPSDIKAVFPGAEDERLRLGAACAASAWNRAGFEYHQRLAEQAREQGGAPLALCFAVHPQLPAAVNSRNIEAGMVEQSLNTLAVLAESGQLDAIGETGFDLYDRSFRDTEAAQDALFAVHLDIALERRLPLVFHIRRAMHKVFAHSAALKRLPAVVFHSYPGTLSEGESLLRRGVNAYFSFGAAIAMNHKTAAEACARLPAERLLTETDAPYQPPRCAAFSRWRDLGETLRTLTELRREDSAADLEARIDQNWRRVFMEER
ncbi:MAG: TatD family hydrolase [Treponema sp.]|jgi:TatD DNase family protein|nr:TatD family hydrolase [Treponema sp.]